MNCRRRLRMRAGTNGVVVSCCVESAADGCSLSLCRRCEASGVAVSRAADGRQTERVGCGERCLPRAKFGCSIQRVDSQEPETHSFNQPTDRALTEPRGAPRPQRSCWWMLAFFALHGDDAQPQASLVGGAACRLRSSHTGTTVLCSSTTHIHSLPTHPTCPTCPTGIT